MKTKSFGHGKYSCHTYLKKVGSGWETGFVFNHKTIFVGNFIHQKEGTTWFKIMNREIERFSKKYAVGTRFPITWFSAFISHHLYSVYYTHLDTVFSHYNKSFTQAVVKDLRKYRSIRKTWTKSEVRPFYKKHTG